MKKQLCLVLTLWLSLAGVTSTYAQEVAGPPKLSVQDRMAKARAVKAQKKMDGSTRPSQPQLAPLGRATSADDKSPVDKIRKGPNGEVIHVGERGARYYINKNGNKTYLSSNQ